MSKFSSNLLAGSIAIFSLVMLTVGTVQAQPAGTASVVVSVAQIDALQKKCVAGGAPVTCSGAVQALIAALLAANPGMSVAVILGSVAAMIASISNDGVAGKITIDPAALGLALSSLASVAQANGLADFAKTLVALADNVKNGVSIDLAAIASGDGTTLADNFGSPA